jgi:hypothetical protein
VHTNIQSWGHGTHWIQHTKSKEKWTIDSK